MLWSEQFAMFLTKCIELYSIFYNDWLFSHQYNIQFLCCYFYTKCANKLWVLLFLSLLVLFPACVLQVSVQILGNTVAMQGVHCTKRHFMSYEILTLTAMTPKQQWDPTKLYCTHCSGWRPEQCTLSYYLAVCYHIIVWPDFFILSFSEKLKLYCGSKI